MNETKGILFDSVLVQELKNQFFMPNEDPRDGERLFFDNSGGSLRLQKAVEVKADLERYPDCPERDHERGLTLKAYVQEGTKELLDIVFNAKSGALMSELTASQCMFQIVDLIMDNVEGTNAVVSVLEHPSAFDAMQFHCKKHGRELRVAQANKETGRIDPDEVARLVDQNTCLVSIMSASNISGSVMDMEGIVKAVRAIKPDIYIISDAVQHAPHMIMDVETLGLDAMNFAPYKFFSVRGCGFAYVSDRVAHMPHHKIIAKDPKVFELGTPAPGNFAAMMAVVDYVCSIGKKFIASENRKELYYEGMKRIHLQERALLHYMLEGTKEIPGLRHIPGVAISADTDSVEGRDLIAGIRIEGMDVIELGEEYQRRGVTTAARAATSIYSKRIVEALGADKGLVRVSPMHCHGTEDIDKFLNITKEIATR
ncbi:aminotransferase class V-fold PLP-dependent enzyme [Chakrabartyella piscis]|uniref:aminotransferase class V-fold PLP-dependent enzyme n=1 Tax=Chakrabartyella piscis TaxID=2918914 RepID=UPI002958571C|nr:aminotransferase class V-fold PLP-dependent enzyme [Chakrabartyella piscis]